MPTYTYKCKKCSHSIDIFHAISAKPKVTCPKCGSACRRMIGTGAGIIFKGSGFYETDYKRSSSSSSAGGSESKTESKSESKTDTKTETKHAKKAAGAD